MSIRPAAWRAAPLALLLLPLLSGCGPTRDQFPPACPAAELMSPIWDITLYRPGATRNYLDDRVLQGHIVAIDGRCHQGGNNSRLDAEVSLKFRFTRGPAMQGNSVTVPVFIAVTEGGRILTERTFGVAADFPANVDQIERTLPKVDVLLPVSPAKSGAAYRIIAGFRLTREQLQAERARQ